MLGTYIHIPETDSYWKLQKRHQENKSIKQSFNQAMTPSVSTLTLLNPKETEMKVFNI
jgi:hypothetical protein